MRTQGKASRAKKWAAQEDTGTNRTSGVYEIWSYLRILSLVDMRWFCYGDYITEPTSNKHHFLRLYRNMDTAFRLTFSSLLLAAISVASPLSPLPRLFRPDIKQRQPSLLLTDSRYPFLRPLAFYPAQVYFHRYEQALLQGECLGIFRAFPGTSPERRSTQLRADAHCHLVVTNIPYTRRHPPKMEPFQFRNTDGTLGDLELVEEEKNPAGDTGPETLPTASIVYPQHILRSAYAQPAYCHLMHLEMLDNTLPANPQISYAESRLTRSSAFDPCPSPMTSQDPIHQACRRHSRLQFLRPDNLTLDEDEGSDADSQDAAQQQLEKMPPIGSISKALVRQDSSNLR
ncbi:uncharacterized protein BDR25DRAFT_349185 [Lindgomyces ingoldianus]|uniref:Uncharacterized protein n=1 Tax=Lindgomyces ingoldianus TaxID=673940 RepID=A0ACB6RDX9_9PLEO|nr:uncharacterized protein BDR25DRAFT_349185 [Lindgomyces ingoldianus]KAF2477240.1 hypothetical protein BDR25DRAFT_349185 [Lindgomyces ingoldianus]